MSRDQDWRLFPASPRPLEGFWEPIVLSGPPRPEGFSHEDYLFKQTGRAALQTRPVAIAALQELRTTNQNPEYWNYGWKVGRRVGRHEESCCNKCSSNMGPLSNNRLLPEITYFGQKTTISQKTPKRNKWDPQLLLPEESSSSSSLLR